MFGIIKNFNIMSLSQYELCKEMCVTLIIYVRGKHLNRYKSKSKRNKRIGNIHKVFFLDLSCEFPNPINN